MQIDFFEEFPSNESLSKLRLIKFRTNLYIAAKNLKEFRYLENRIKESYKNVDKIVYWPILKLDEGYWMSVFSKTSAVKRIQNELRETNQNFRVLWDAELPILNKKLFITQLPHFFTNRKIIQGILNKNHSLIVTATPKSGISKLFLYSTCTYFPSGSFHYIDMLYSSLLKVKNKSEYLRGFIKNNKHKFRNYSVALGLIGRGVEDHTIPLISPSQLEKDLTLVQKERIENVILYRLGGLNKEYLRVLEKFAS
ncbi:MAG: hypothetical protein A2186_00145 [Candidatus Levybacteria bacterium RIFOXYA1_FULL_41_10]|nr:MAG: hypothetical protein UT44_C0022G0001 [Candidatus Levybacteria bacterium GW2011_GWA1_39_32]KKR50113.1 MAG: hypothetical protein UT87_C0020G0001 [Candidatus Levybacteria bacterium GW2011_GWC1_40_19]KKR71324.1 MAG: hypothetical protein UU15_C0054G0004 [Candidatus Levybacteria bacterium GW2011_GWC2_40_7]KKR94961.1 MAG: hypothetical protein UU45_C0005G0019 [Candidatus Levybacteria bacterium GW2011_GWA2_41_15]OGH21119.1 MAG: hypothetical protein A2695_00120 [Candidatus Levybacteria bacterium 